MPPEIGSAECLQTVGVCRDLRQRWMQLLPETVKLGIQYDDGRTEEGYWRFLAAGMHRMVYRSVGSARVFKLQRASADMGELTQNQNEYELLLPKNELKELLPPSRGRSSKRTPSKEIRSADHRRYHMGPLTG